jgi:hypothetical protein
MMTLGGDPKPRSARAGAEALAMREIMTDPKYAAFRALDPFFDIVQQALAGLGQRERLAGSRQLCWGS